MKFLDVTGIIGNAWLGVHIVLKGQEVDAPLYMAGVFCTHDSMSLQTTEIMPKGCLGDQLNTAKCSFSSYALDSWSYRGSARDVSNIAAAAIPPF